MKKSIKMMEKTGIMILLSLLFILPVQASTNVSNQISDVQNQQKETQSNLNKTKDQIKQLEETKSNMEGDLNTLNTQLSDLSKKLDELESQISSKQQEIETTKADLEEAKRQEEEQYAAMKKRIQFMYESGDSVYLSIFLEADNLTDLLNRAEYISKIYDYDRDMLMKYQETKTQIAKKEVQLKNEQEDLIALQGQVQEKETEVTGLVQATSKKINSYTGKITNAQNVASQYEKELLAQEEKLEVLKAKEAAQKQAAEKKKAQEAAEKKKAEEAAKAAAKNNDTSAGSGSQTSASSGSSTDTASKGSPTGPVNISAGDLELLAAIIECEAGGESMEGKLAVGSVVMNRVRSGTYPNTILGVIYQSGQFSPVTSGRFSIVLARGASDSCVSAAQQVLGGYSSGSWLHFCRANGLVEGDVIGNHVFY